MHSTEDLRRAMISAADDLAPASGAHQIVRAGRRRKHRRRATAVAGAACLAVVAAVAVPSLLRDGEQISPASGAACSTASNRGTSPGPAASAPKPFPDPTPSVLAKPKNLLDTGARSASGEHLVLWFDCADVNSEYEPDYRAEPVVRLGSLHPGTDQVNTMRPTNFAWWLPDILHSDQPGFVGLAYTRDKKDERGILYGLVRGPVRRMTAPPGTEVGFARTADPQLSIFWVTNMRGEPRAHHDDRGERTVGSVVALDNAGAPIDEILWPHGRPAGVEAEPGFVFLDSFLIDVSPRRELFINIVRQDGKTMLRTVEMNILTGRRTEVKPSVPIDLTLTRPGFSDLDLTVPGFTGPIHIGMFVGSVGQVTATDGGKRTKTAYIRSSQNQKINIWYAVGTAPQVTVYDLSGKVIGRR